MKTKGIIHAYGLFWQRDEVDWTPGNGVRRSSDGGYRLLGRIGANKGTIRAADFRDQKGIYILHDHYGTCYVGLTYQGDHTIGKRLLEHHKNKREREWDRFSWFGFRQVRKMCDSEGLHPLRAMAALSSIQAPSLIRDAEAMLQRALGPRGNKNLTKFANAEEWSQVHREEIVTTLNKLAR